MSRDISIFASPTRVLTQCKQHKHEVNKRIQIFGCICMYVETCLLRHRSMELGVSDAHASLFIFIFILICILARYTPITCHVRVVFAFSSCFVVLKVCICLFSCSIHHLVTFLRDCARN